MSDFDLMELIAAPIIAMNEAESDNAVRFVELLQDFAFIEDPVTGAKKLQNLEFSFDRADADGQIRVQTVSIPLLQFMPIGGVSIDQATLNYALKLQPQATKKNGRLRMAGHIADGYEKTTGLSGNVNIEIKLRQIDLPQGVLTMLETAQAAVTHTDTTPEIIEPEPPTPLPEITDTFIDVVLLDREPRLIEAGQDQVSVFGVGLSEAVKAHGAKVEVELSSWPKAALEFEDKGSFTIADDRELKLGYLVSPAVERYAARTGIKLVMNAKVTAGTGDVIAQKIEFPLARKL